MCLSLSRNEPVLLWFRKLSLNFWIQLPQGLRPTRWSLRGLCIFWAFSQLFQSLGNWLQWLWFWDVLMSQEVCWLPLFSMRDISSQLCSPICCVSLPQILHLNQTLKLYGPGIYLCSMLPCNPGQIILPHCNLFFIFLNKWGKNRMVLHHRVLWRLNELLHVRGILKVFNNVHYYVSLKKKFLLLDSLSLWILPIFWKFWNFSFCL